MSTTYCCAKLDVSALFRAAIVLVIGIAAAIPAYSSPAGTMPNQTEPTAAARLEVPIERLLLPDGAIRFGVPLQIDGFPPLVALLDTGSTGLRVLGVPHAATQTSQHEVVSYAYMSGVRVSGVMVSLSVSFPGGTTKATQVHLIDRVACVEAHPNCPASRIPFEEYRFGGNGAPETGYQAILGIRAPPTGSRWTNPLAAMAKRWIIEAPRAAEREGRLILNPAPADLQGFEWIPAAAGEIRGAGGAVPGCISIDDDVQACGDVVFDLGANGLRVPWSDDLPAANKWRDKVLKMHIGGRSFMTVIGQRPPLDRIVALRDGKSDSPILAGALPYMFWDVLYDVSNPGLGLRERPSPPAIEP